jgi:hypothetical protein
MSAKEMRSSRPKLRFRKALPVPTDRLPLSGTLKVSPLCLGMVRDPRTVSHAFDRGINFFFVTADMHWPAYEATRRGLQELFARSPSVREQVVVAVVAYVTQPEFCHMPFRETLDAIPGLGHIDLSVAGGSYRSDFAPRKAQFALHGPLGVRAFGVSFHDRRMAAKAIREKLVDIGFVRYNALHLGAEKDLFPHVPARTRARRPLLFNFTSTTGFIRPEHYAALGLTSDHWQPAITDYYRFVLARPEIDGLLCAPTTPDQVDALIAALASGPLTEEEQTYIRDLGALALGEARLA